MLLALALIPAVVLLVYIFIKDRREKESFKILFLCFLFGVLSTIPAIIFETVGELIFDPFLTNGSFAYAIVDAFIVVAISEEGCKYFMLKKRTWKSKEFNCSFDGIVYAVFVSLGFAAFENIFYVFENGFSNAIMRMFTAVPSHACDAVYMGFFYSLAKEASLKGNKRAERRNKRLALFVPVLLHGLYDCLLSVDEEVVGEIPLLLCLVSWLALVVCIFFVSFKLVKRASNEDRYFNPLEEYRG